MSAPDILPAPPVDALIIVDTQRDFLPGGALAVPDGDAVVPVLNAWGEAFARAGCPVFATRDWHPADHCSFRAQGGLWPPHCIIDSAGARFAGDLRLPAGTVVVSKPAFPDHDVFSGFEGTGLAERLRDAGVRCVWVGGLATEYCVRSTVLHALELGFEVRLLTDAIRGVEVSAGDSARALEDMRAAGARFVAGAPAGCWP